MKSLLTIIIGMLIAACGSTYQKRNAELIVTYEGKEVHRAGSKFASYRTLKEAADISTKKYIIFSASWCDSCKFLNKALEQSGHTDSVTLIDIDETWVAELANIYEVTSFPTMIVVDEESNLIAKLSTPSTIIMYLLIKIKSADEL